MSIIIIGLNHKTAPVKIRERFAFHPDHIYDALKNLAGYKLISEAVILSTCNRVEVIVSTPSIEDSRNVILQIYDYLHHYHSCNLENIKKHFYEYEGNDAIRHIFRVASSLDSMVIGETQVNGQIKEAFRIAQEVGTIGNELNKVITRAFSIAKRIRRETGIGVGVSSISSVAIELARKTFIKLEGKAVMLVGAGKTAELAAKQMVAYGAKKIWIANRTQENGVLLAEKLNGTAIQFSELHQRMSDVDIVICSTNAPNYLINQLNVKAVLRARDHRQILLLDLSVPRNIDPVVGSIDNVILYNVDNLKAISEENQSTRRKEALKAELICETETAKFISGTSVSNKSNAIIDVANSNVCIQASKLMQPIISHFIESRNG